MAVIVPLFAKKLIAPSVAVIFAFFTVKSPSEYKPIDSGFFIFILTFVFSPINFPFVPFFTIIPYVPFPPIGSELSPLLFIVTSASPSKVISDWSATIPATLFPETFTFPFICKELSPDTKTPVELSPDTSTNSVTPVEGAPPTVPVDSSFNKIPILLVSPVPKSLIDPLFLITEWSIPTIPVPFLISVLLIVPVLVIFAFFANIPIP